MRLSLSQAGRNGSIAEQEASLPLLVLSLRPRHPGKNKEIANEDIAKGSGDAERRHKSQIRAYWTKVHYPAFSWLPMFNFTFRQSGAESLCFYAVVQWSTTGSAGARATNRGDSAGVIRAWISHYPLEVVRTCTAHGEETVASQI
jgi:hypothetical protein